MWIVRLSVMALAAVLAACAPVAMTESYPIWWSPSLELTSLDQIDARLQRDLWPGLDAEIEVYLNHDSAKDKAIARNCKALIELTDADYWALSSLDYFVQRSKLAHCRAIEMLGQGRTADISYLRNFAMNDNAVIYLPALVGLTSSCRQTCEYIVANARGLALPDFETIIRIEELSDDEMVITSEGWQVRREVLARGEFTADGVDDILLYSGGGAIGGSFATASLFLLTRSAPNAILWVVDAERYVCPRRKCEY